MTNKMTKLQLVGSLGTTLSLFENYEAEMKMTGNSSLYFSLIILYGKQNSTDLS
jgi:hypothetical protein